MLRPVLIFSVLLLLSFVMFERQLAVVSVTGTPVLDENTTRTALQDLESRLEDVSPSLPNPPHISDDGTIHCGDLLAIGGLEGASDTGGAVAGAVDKFSRLDYDTTRAEQERLERSSFEYEVKEDESMLDLLDRVDRSDAKAAATIRSRELQNSIRVAAYGSQMLRDCEELYYKVQKSNMDLQKGHMERIARSMRMLEIKTNSDS